MAMKFDSKYPWYVVDCIIFLAVNILMVWLIKPNVLMLQIFTPWKILLFGLAVYRGADIISNETITEPIRAPFVRIQHEHGKYIEQPEKTGFKGALGSLLYCPSCTGMWVAMILVYAYFWLPGPVEILVIILVISALERIFTNAINILKKLHTTTLQ